MRHLMAIQLMTPEKNKKENRVSPFAAISLMTGWKAMAVLPRAYSP